VVLVLLSFLPLLLYFQPWTILLVISSSVTTFRYARMIQLYSDASLILSLSFKQSSERLSTEPPSLSSEISVAISQTSIAGWKGAFIAPDYYSCSHHGGQMHHGKRVLKLFGLH
jgi:hypothetical protein